MAKKKGKKKASRKPIFREAVRDYGEKIFDCSLDQADDKQRSHAMTKFFVEEILQKIQPGIIPDDPEDLEYCYVDGKHDQGVDFIFRSDGYVQIVQAKYHGKRSVEDKHEVDSFLNVLTRLHPTLGKSFKKNEKLEDAIADIDWRKDTFALYFISLGASNDDIRAIMAVGPPPIAKPNYLKDLSDRTEALFYDERDLNDVYREALSTGQQIREVTDLRFSVGKNEPPWIVHETDDHVSYVGKVSAGQLGPLYRQRRNRLFSMNIRNFVGNTATNKGIIETALSAPNNFFFFNNGISAISTGIKADAKSGILHCERLSIINGAQTVRSLAKAHGRNAETARDAQVLIRVTEAKFSRKAKEQAFIDNVTKFNNTQNAIKISDFRSNDPVQVSLAQHFSQLSRAGKKYWYKNKRTGEIRSHTIAISMEDFAKTIFAFSYGPMDMFGGTKHLFDTDENGGYAKIFGKDGEIFGAVSQDQFKTLAGMWFFCTEIKSALVDEKERRIEEEREALELIEDRDPVVRHALERRWLVYFAAGELLRKVCKNKEVDIDDQLKFLSRPANLDKAETKNRIAEYTDVACEILIKDYGFKSQSDRFVHRNWFRSQDTLRDIRSEIATASRLVRTLPLIRG